MRSILIDLYKIKELYSGLGQFSKNFGNEFINQLPSGFEVGFLKPNSSYKFTSTKVTSINSTLIRRYLPFVHKKHTIWHSLQQFPSFLPRKSSFWILTIHDLNFLQEKNERKKNRYLHKLQKNVNRADCITAISFFTKSEIEKHINLKGKKIEVIYNGVSSGETIVKKEPDYAKGQKYFFSIGIFNQKKNFEVLLPLMVRFPDYKLIIAGNYNTAYGECIQKDINEQGLEDRVVLPGKINDENKQWLYANCEAFLFPSMAEGFGLPVIEAMYEGVPVFLSKFTSLPEIGGDTAFYFDDFTADGMSEVITKGLEEVERKGNEFVIESKRYANKFRWENCIQSYISLYNKALEDTKCS